MWLAYGIRPYSAHGSQVVWNCDPAANGCWLEQVTNGTPGRAPQPGDVLSYGSTSTYGHTAVVASSSVNANGDGTVRVVEQNSAADGDSVLTVDDWVVLGSTSGWLHDAGNYSVSIPPAAVAVHGPVSAMVYTSQAFTATVSPIATRRPITYVWQIPGQPAIVHTAALSDVLVLTWVSAGEQTITVTADNGVGLVTAGHSVSVQAPLQAGFEGSPLAGQAPLAVAFTDTSSGFVEGWQWKFGDGATSATQHPVHTYTQAGTYPVTLTVTGPGGADTRVRPAYIRVSPGPVAANFYAVPLVGPIPLAVQFMDASAGDVTSWEWNLGDGTLSTVPSPSHTYIVSGVYTVTLTVSGVGGADTEIKTRYVAAAEWKRTHIPLMLMDYVPPNLGESCVDLVVNGGFEQQDGWGLPGTVYTATYTTEPVRSGGRAVRVGIVDPADNVASYSSVRQLVTIPAAATAATLQVWLYLVSGSSAAALNAPSLAATTPGPALVPAVTDAQYLLILGESGQILETLMWQRTDDRRWALHEYDLLDYAGQSIRLHFGASNDGVDTTTGMVVDDVSLAVCQPIGDPP
jgi:PKD repeat protein